MIVGIDEVGRGAWAGPLVVGAVVLDGVSIDGLTDSKQLSKKQRERLDTEIRQKAKAIGLGWVSARHIDKIGLSAALKLASRRAIAHIQVPYEEIIIDGTVALLEDARVTLMKKADLLVPSVSAASIVAKVARDNYMKHVDLIFPGYKFPSHVGYGTATHQTAIKQNGVTPLHRLSFGPLQTYRRKVTKAIDEQTTKYIGNRAEVEVAEYLRANGHEIIARNWRTRYCEIDIISRHHKTVYFTEVKYRSNNSEGSGFAAITAKKQRQMTFAAEYYAAKNQLSGQDIQLAAAEIVGPLRRLTFLKLF